MVYKTISRSESDVSTQLGAKMVRIGPWKLVTKYTSFDQARSNSLPNHQRSLESIREIKSKGLTLCAE